VTKTFALAMATDTFNTLPEDFVENSRRRGLGWCSW
jgi:hypothetical protein